MTPAVRRALADIAGQDGINQNPISTGMVRLLNRDNLLNSICMCSSERWRSAGSPAGKLAFETPYGFATLDADGSLPFVTSADAFGFESVTPMSQSSLFGLLFGSLGPHQATSEISLHPLISALFPSRDMVYWGVDGF